MFTFQANHALRCEDKVLCLRSCHTPNNQEITVYRRCYACVWHSHILCVNWKSIKRPWEGNQRKDRARVEFRRPRQSIDDIVWMWTWNISAYGSTTWCNHCSAWHEVDLQLAYVLMFKPPLYKCKKMEQDDSDGYACVRACSSSSADSVVGGSDDAHVHKEEVVEDEEGSELVLVPRGEVWIIEMKLNY